MGHPYWPLFDLRIETPVLTLRYVDDELASELVALAAKGIHDPAFMPFSIPWTDLASPERERQSFQFYWRRRAEVSPTSFSLPLAVLVDGNVIGMSDVLTTDFPTLRQFETGSWLGLEHQGKGFGKEMRLASLTLGFDGLGADFALTVAWHDNGPSLGVTRALGYEQTGRRRSVRRDVADEIVGFQMTKSHFDTIRRDDITIHNLENCLDLLGLA